jgi:hypothetical protein
LGCGLCHAVHKTKVAARFAALLGLLQSVL